MKRIASTLLAVCMVLLLLPVTAAATSGGTTTSLPTVKLDVGAENKETGEYKIMDDAINLKSADTVYELIGSTNRNIYMWGSNDLDNIKTFYLRLNQVTLNSGITINNPDGARLVVEVVDDTDNTVSRLRAVDLTITGAGTITSGNIGSNYGVAANPGKLYIKDTKIVMTQTGGDSVYWNGTCVLDGNADVTITSTTEYSALKLGASRSISHSLTLKGNARLRCLQANIDDPSSGYVSGLEAFGDTTTITLQDSAYLEAQGRAGVDSEYGYTGGNGIASSSDIIVENNATLKATAYGVGIDIWGSVKVSGGKIIAQGEKSNGIYAAGNIEIKNATAEISGYYPALFSTEVVSIENSKVNASSTGDCAIFSQDTIEIKDSVVEANAPEGIEGIYCWYGTKVSGSWITTSGSETLDTGDDSIADSVLFNGKTGKVIGNAKLLDDVTLENDMTLTVPAGTSLTVPNGKTLTNNGTINLLGDLYHSDNDATKGDVICNSHSGGTATCAEPAKCDICQKSYGEKDSANHTNLKHFSANAPTVSKDGNTEYWYCEGCGKYFSDANAANEITKDATVIPALKSTSITPANDKTYTKGSKKDLAFTVKNLPEGFNVKVGSTTLTEGKDFTVSGDTLVLKSSYLETLGYGSYTLSIMDDGSVAASTTFNVGFAARPAQRPAFSGNGSSTSTSSVKSAGTGDMGVALYAVTAVLSLTGSAWVVGRKRSR